MGEQEDRSFPEQPEGETPKSLEDVKDWDELYAYLRMVGRIEGSHRTYEAEELIEIIDKVRFQNVVEGVVTRSGGLRDKVHKLLMGK